MYIAKILKKFIYFYIREMYPMLNFLAPYLNLDTALCLYFDLKHQRYALHIT